MSVEGVNQNSGPLSEEERARIAQIENARALSDAVLIKGGAEYVVDENGEKRLEVTEEQKNEEFKLFKRLQEWDEQERERNEKREHFKKLIFDFFEKNDVKLRDNLLIDAKSGSWSGRPFSGWRLLHSIDEYHLSLIDEGVSYGGSLEFMGQMRERGKRALENNMPTDIIPLEDIESIKIYRSHEVKELILPE